MNKTLLLVLCDFLLLSLLALTRWEDARPAAPTSARPAPAASSAGAATPEQDLVAVMKLSLEDEQARRIAVADDLARTEAARAEAEAAKARLVNDLLATEKNAAALGENLAATRAAAEAERARNEALALELSAREAEAKRREAELARIAAAEGAARAELFALAFGARGRGCSDDTSNAACCDEVSSSASRCSGFWPGSRRTSRRL